MSLDPQHHLIERLMNVRAMPPVLYHYTTAPGLEGILRSRRIWASHVRYLNDSSEYQYTITMATSHLSTLQRSAAHTQLAPLYGEWQQALRLAEENHVYAVSLSASRDLLSQWQAYGRNGYAIGFDQTHLLAIGAAYGGRVGFLPCIYERAAQEEILAYATTYLQECYLTDLKGTPNSGAVLELFGAHFFGHVTMLAACFKDHHFQPENEWRLVFHGPEPTTGGDELRFRAGRSTTIPYLEIPIATDEPDVPLFRLDVAPGKAESAVQEASALLKRHGFAAREVSPSAIPWRET